MLIADDPKSPLKEYLSLLRPGGTFVLVGAAEAESIPQISAFEFLMSEQPPPRLVSQSWY